MIIETQYQSLSQIDSKVVGYYSKEIRDKETVIFLNQPDVVTYNDVALRVSERKPWEVVRSELLRAIEYEEFYYKHDLYLQWVNDYAQWQSSQSDEEDPTPAPIQPTIDLSRRRAFYQTTEDKPDERYYVLTGGYDEAHDDEQLTTMRTLHATKRPAEEIAALHEAEAKQYRDTLIESDIEVHGVWWQVAKKDRDNINEAVAYVTRNSLSMDLTRQWILADNSVRETTVAELAEVLDAYTERLDAVYRAYAEWRAGDKQDGFVL
ncbi:DUF4376 domain-containing protein [Vibrio vulnificus]|uniref:DUF4376 domain-containing protein n=1 Tax=Vibrio vulnificus TaxID=672 RepID=UPI000C7E52A5|nr:DUF4376 domain-containing protein [Vibrio vulnificus]AUL97502.1 hypothetical protein FORC54_3357 [Vibrio vulnificus]